MPAEHLYQVGDQCYYWRGVTKTKSQWAHRWMGPAIVVGIEANNLWVSHRGNLVKRASRHVRPAEMEELIPWEDILSTLDPVVSGSNLQYEDRTPQGPGRFGAHSPTTFHSPVDFSASRASTRATPKEETDRAVSEQPEFPNPNQPQAAEWAEGRGRGGGKGKFRREQ